MYKRFTKICKQFLNCPEGKKCPFIHSVFDSIKYHRKRIERLRKIGNKRKIKFHLKVISKLNKMDNNELSDDILGIVSGFCEDYNDKYNIFNVFPSSINNISYNLQNQPELKQVYYFELKEVYYFETNGESESKESKTNESILCPDNYFDILFENINNNKKFLFYWKIFHLDNKDLNSIVSNKNTLFIDDGESITSVVKRFGNVDIFNILENKYLSFNEEKYEEKKSNMLFALIYEIITYIHKISNRCNPKKETDQYLELIKIIELDDDFSLLNEINISLINEIKTFINNFEFKKNNLDNLNYLFYNDLTTNVLSSLHTIIIYIFYVIIKNTNLSLYRLEKLIEKIINLDINNSYDYMNKNNSSILYGIILIKIHNLINQEEYDKFIFKLINLYFSSLRPFRENFITNFVKIVYSVKNKYNEYYFQKYNQFHYTIFRNLHAVISTKNNMNNYSSNYNIDFKFIYNTKIIISEIMTKIMKLYLNIYTELFYDNNDINGNYEEINIETFVFYYKIISYDEIKPVYQTFIDTINSSEFATIKFKIYNNNDKLLSIIDNNISDEIIKIIKDDEIKLVWGLPYIRPYFIFPF